MWNAKRLWPAFGRLQRAAVLRHFESGGFPSVAPSSKGAHIDQRLPAPLLDETPNSFSNT